MAQRKPKKPEKPPLPEPDSDVQNAMIRAAGRVLKRRPRVAVAMDGSNIEPPHAKSQGWLANLMDAAGTRSDPFMLMLLDQLARQSRWHGESGSNERRVNGFLALLDGCEPENEAQAMLVAQMAAAHDLAMEMASRCKQADMLPQLNDMGNLSVKLMRTFAMQAEALAKLKRGGEQRVKVEHLHVHSGGQAIVGNVQTGGGVPAKIEDQPHAITDASNDLLRCQDAQGEPVPIPANGERPL